MKKVLIEVEIMHPVNLNWIIDAIKECEGVNTIRVVKSWKQYHYDNVD